MTDLSNENIIHIQNGDIECIQFRKLLEYENILKHAISLKPMNFNFRTVLKQKLEDNYEKFCNNLGISKKNIIRTEQTHSDNIAIISNENKSTYFDNTDGFITNEKDIALPIITADCIAFLLFDPVKKVIANVHSGWRGTVQRIVKKAVDNMVNIYNCNPKDIICCIAPSIGKCHFEVKEDVKKIFKEEFQDVQNEDIIIKDSKSEETYFIDTVLINKLMLLNLGLREENIIQSNMCTVCNSIIFHSYRKEGDMSGRNLNIISLV